MLLLEAQAYEDSDKQSNHPSFDSRSTALSWSSRKIFQGAGLWSELESHTSAIKKIHVSDRGHIGLTRISADEAGVEALGYVIENRWIGAVLLGKLAATSVEMMAPERVAKIIPLKSGVRIELENSGETIQALATGDRRRRQFQTAEKLGIHSDSNPMVSRALSPILHCKMLIMVSPMSALPIRAPWPCCRCQTLMAVPAVPWSGHSRRSAPQN